VGGGGVPSTPPKLNCIQRAGKSERFPGGPDGAPPLPESDICTGEGAGRGKKSRLGNEVTHTVGGSEVVYYKSYCIILSTILPNHSTTFTLASVQLEALQPSPILTPHLMEINKEHVKFKVLAISL
jgi:hypothetical protein